MVSSIQTSSLTKLLKYILFIISAGIFLALCYEIQKHHQLKLHAFFVSSFILRLNYFHETQQDPKFTTFIPYNKDFVLIFYSRHVSYQIRRSENKNTHSPACKEALYQDRNLHSATS